MWLCNQSKEFIGGIYTFNLFNVANTTSCTYSVVHSILFYFILFIYSINIYRLRVVAYSHIRSSHPSIPVQITMPVEPFPSWQAIKATSRSQEGNLFPAPRRGHSLVSIENKIFLFGGTTEGC